jgi:hypothetical protein
MHITLRSIALSFAILVTGASATVSLSSFTPRVDNIDNTQCRAAYTTTIKGCVASDFSPPNRCSSACVQGLVDIGALIQRVCANVDVGETSIIGVFQFGIGIASLCPGVEVVTITSKSQAQTTWTATSRPATNSVPPAYSLATTFTSTTASTTSASSSQAKSTLSSVASSSQAIVTDPNPTSIPGVSPTGTVQQPAATSTAARPVTPNAQLSNADSGGGSPFDVQAVSASSHLQVLSSTTAALLGSAILFVLCA